jgi:hypothetical protein
MIQRIQTVYLALVALITGLAINYLPLWTVGEQSLFYKDDIQFMIPALLSTVLAIVTIFLYKNRQNQFVSVRLLLLINLILLGLLLYRLLNLPGEPSGTEKGIGLLVPIVSIVLLFLASRAIRKDEELVKSVDRLR